MKMNELQKFENLYREFFNELNSKYNIVVAGAHLYDLNQKKRIHQYLHVADELKKENFIEALNKAFFQIKDRAKFFEIVNIRSKRKRPLLWIRTSFISVFEDLINYRQDQILIPGDMFLNSENLRKKIILKKESLKNILKEKWNDTREKSEWTSFYFYFCHKMIEILNSDISENYRPQFDIFVMLNSILTYNWKYLYFFPTDPPGGFYIHLNQLLEEHDIERYYRKAQEITSEKKL
jgi:hypothetical protein